MKIQISLPHVVLSGVSR